MDKLRLVLTCGSCPEQYDGYLGDEKVAYFRLRHGTFRVEYRGHTVFTGQPNGDGIFDTDERNYWLELGTRAVLEAHEKYNVNEENLSFEIENPQEIEDDWYK
jgi:hypothetical protein